MKTLAAVFNSLGLLALLWQSISPVAFSMDGVFLSSAGAYSMAPLALALWVLFGPSRPWLLWTVWAFNLLFFLFLVFGFLAIRSLPAVAFDSPVPIIIRTYATVGIVLAAAVCNLFAVRPPSVPATSTGHWGP